MEQQRTPEKPVKPWEVPRWISRVGEWMAHAVSAAGALGTFFIALGAFGRLGSWWEFAAFLAVPIFGVLATAVHEIGHLVGASSAGMKPMFFQILHIVLTRQRRGWSFRLGKLPKGIAGYAIAYPDPKRSLKSSMLRMIAGGPLANLAFATLLFLLFIAAGKNFAGLLLLSFGILNATIGIANLMPSMRHHVSDGLQLLWWLRGLPDRHPDTMFMRLMGRSVFGETADQFDCVDLDQLAQQSAAMSIVADWLRMKAAQNRGEWSIAVEHGARLQANADLLPGPQQKDMKHFIAIGQVECSFSSAMAALDARCLPGEELLLAIEPYAPHLVFRIDALRRSFADDRSGMLEKLVQSERHAGKSVDDALIKSEEKIRNSIIESFQAAGNPDVARLNACRYA